MATYLDSIVAAHRAAAAEDRRDPGAVLEQARAQPAPRAFAGELRALAERQGVAVIAEIKRRSPSKGDLDPDLDPAAVAKDYEAGGAACLSVLTDAEFFGAQPGDLAAAREACGLPVLRKDFTVSELDVGDARLTGADAVLLIVAALSDDELARFHGLADACGLAALVEVHDAAELDRARSVGATLIGVNQRDLHTFEVDHRRALDLAPSMPEGAVPVAESGIRDADDVRRLSEAGYRAVLVGETLLRSSDRQAAVAELAESGR